jgi:hypothetical protein
MLSHHRPVYNGNAVCFSKPLLIIIARCQNSSPPTYSPYEGFPNSDVQVLLRPLVLLPILARHKRRLRAIAAAKSSGGDTIGARELVRGVEGVNPHPYVSGHDFYHVIAGGPRARSENRWSRG